MVWSRGPYLGYLEQAENESQNEDNVYVKLVSVVKIFRSNTRSCQNLSQCC